jgi:hypothetical protein
MFTSDPHGPSTGNVGTVRLHDVQDLLTAVPYILGFRPDQCLVVVALDDAGRLVVTARTELPEAATVDEAAAGLHRAFSQSQPSTVLVIGYCERRDAPIVSAFADALPWPVRDLLLVDGGRWWSLDCPSPGCCSPDGEPLVVRDGVAAPLLVASGAPAASREDLAACLAAGPQEVRDAVLRHLLTTDRPGRADLYAALEQARRARADGAKPVAPAEAALLLLATADLTVRDACTLWSDDAAVRLWLDLLATAPDGWAAPVATLLATAVYQRGDGAFAVMGLERALADNPGYHFAHLLGQAAAMGLTPPAMTAVLRQALAGNPLVPQPPTGG